MSSVSASRIKRQTLYTRTVLQACRADPGLSVLTGYYGVYHYMLGPTAGQILFIFFIKKVCFFSDRYKTLPNQFLNIKSILLDILVAWIMIIGSRDNNNCILTMDSGAHFENCLW